MVQAPLGFTTFFWLLLIAFLVAIVARRFQAPYALVLVITGLVIGAPRLLPHVHLDPQTLFAVFRSERLSGGDCGAAFSGAVRARAGDHRAGDWRAAAAAPRSPRSADAVRGVQIGTPFWWRLWRGVFRRRTRSCW